MKSSFNDYIPIPTFDEALVGMNTNRLLLLLVTYSLTTTHSICDEPSVSYIFPAGGQRGTTVKFNVGGHYLHESCPFEMLGPGVDASSEIHRAEKTVWFEGPVIPEPASQRKENYPKDQAGEVKISADAPLGFRRWRVWTSQGVTPSMKFVIGDLPEIVEQEIDGRPIPTSVEVPVTINGRIFPREDVDVWTIEAKAGTSYTCEVMAARLGSPLDSRLEVIGPDGLRVAENTDGRGVDSSLRFTVTIDGEYQVHIHDINFGGLQDYVYRLTITDRPYVDYVYPLGGRRGESISLQLFGQAVGQASNLLKLDDAQQAGSLPHAIEHRFDIDGQLSNPVSVELSNFPEHVETSARRETEFSSPIVLNGKLDAMGEVDVWQVDAKKDDQLVFDLRAAQLGSRLDSVLTIFDANGKQLAQNDDMASGETDSRLTYKVPVDGVYKIQVEDRFKRGGGAAYAYRLYVTPQGEPKPDFDLQLPTDVLTILPKSQPKIKLTVARQGFEGDIEITAENLPEGATLKGDKVTIKGNKNDAQLQFIVAEGAKHQMKGVKIVGTAKDGDTTITRTAHTLKSSPDDIEFDKLVMMVAVPTPFKVVGVVGIFETKYAARFTRRFSIERGGYDGPITVSMADRQVRHLQGVIGPTIVIPPGKSEFDYPIKLAPWMVIGRTSRTCVMAVADVSHDGKKHKVSYTSHEQADQVIVLIDPGQLDVQPGRRSLIAKPGQTIDLPIRIGRGKNVRGPLKVELVVPDHVDGISSDPVVIAENETKAVLQLTIADGNSGPFNLPVIIRATAQVDGQPYTAESTVELTLPE